MNNLPASHPFNVCGLPAKDQHPCQLPCFHLGECDNETAAHDACVGAAADECDICG